MLKYIRPTEESKKNGDSKECPFIEITALVGLHSWVNEYAKTAHGGILGLYWVRLWVLLRIRGAARFLLRLPFLSWVLSLNGIKGKGFVSGLSWWEWPDQGAYTVNLNMSHQKTLITPSVVVVRGCVAKKEGRKLQMKGSFEDEKGETIAGAEGLWIMMGKNVGRSNVGREEVKGEVMRRNLRNRRATLDVLITSSIKISTNTLDL